MNGWGLPPGQEARGGGPSPGTVSLDSDAKQPYLFTRFPVQTAPSWQTSGLKGRWGHHGVKDVLGQDRVATCWEHGPWL